MADRYTGQICVCTVDAAGAVILAIRVCTVPMLVAAGVRRVERAGWAAFVDGWRNITTRPTPPPGGAGQVAR